jgi:hypothetical protein
MRLRLEDGSQMDRMELGCEDVWWVEMVQDRVKVANSGMGDVELRVQLPQCQLQFFFYSSL